jgi:outer membrane lipoprotein-sorting protein
MKEERVPDQQKFLKGVADLMEHGHGLETEEQRLDDEIREAGIDPESYATEFRAFLERQIRQSRSAEAAAKTRVSGGWLSGRLEALAISLRERKTWAVATAMAAVCLGILVFRGDTAAMAAEILTQGAQRLAGLSAIHIKARMRTLPRDNFEYIELDHAFVGIDMWKRYGAPPQWRVEKAGRVVVMDGRSATLWIQPDLAAKGGPGAGFVEWLKPLLDIDQVLNHEVDLAAHQGSRLSMRRSRSQKEEVEVTVAAKAQGDFGNDWLKNKSIIEADNRRVYRFDAQTKWLKGLQVYMHGHSRDVLVFEITDIEYNPSLADSLFSLELPKNVVWLAEPQQLADNARYERMLPAEMARAFFQACADRDWVEAAKFMSSASQQDFQAFFGGLRIIQVGKPFKSGLYHGWFVPYQVRLASGEIKKWNLAVRNDNPARRYVVDGGF